MGVTTGFWVSGLVERSDQSLKESTAVSCSFLDASGAVPRDTMKMERTILVHP